jgi:hypothetical protein
VGHPRQWPPDQPGDPTHAHFVKVPGIEIACISNCAIEVIGSPKRGEKVNALAHAQSESKTSSSYQNIFVSYSRRDLRITESYMAANRALMNEVFIDVDNIRAGEDWKAGLAKAIDVADVFQLFWSKNSANSKYCRYEWMYALESRCVNDKYGGFIRPVYWKKPMANPPPELSWFNFRYVPLRKYVPDRRQPPAASLASPPVPPDAGPCRDNRSSTRR